MIKYLAILDSLNEDRDLFSLKDEVKEFKLYDINVQDYYDLFIHVHTFINELD